MTSRRALATGLLAGCAAGCAASIFPRVEHSDPPSHLANDPSGGVVLSSSGVIAFRGGGGGSPYVVVRRQLRVVVTGDLDPGLRQWRFSREPNVKVDLLRARLARRSGEVVELDGLAGDAAGEVTLTIPEPRPGDLIDVVWQRTRLLPETLPPWVFAAPAPTVESQLEVRSPAGWQVHVALGEGAAVKGSAVIASREGSGASLVRSWVERNLEPVPSEPGAVDAQRASPWATAVLVSARVGGETRVFADNWKTVARRVRAALTPTLAVDDEARQSMALGLAKARLRALRRIVRPVAATGGLFGQPFRSFSVLKEQGGATPLEAAAIASQVTADSLEKGHIALVAPLEGPVLVDELPGLYAFRAAAIAFETVDGWEMVDIGCGSCAFGKVPLEIAGGRALILKNDPVITEIPMRAVEPNRRRLQFDWVLDVHGELNGSVSVDLQGEAVRRARDAVALPDDHERLEALTELLLQGGGARVEAITQAGALEPGMPYRLDLAVRARAVRKGDAHFELTTAILGGTSMPWKPTGVRRTAVLLPAPSRLEVTSTLALPPDFKVELPPPVRERLPVGEYSSKFEEQGRVVTYTRRVGMFARNVPVERYAELAALFAQMDQAEARVITIKGED